MKKMLSPRFVFFFFFIFYTLTLTSNFSAAGDGIFYLNEFETGTNLFQSNHLLYHISTFGIFSLLKAVWPGIASHFLVEIISTAWSAGSLTLFFLFLRYRFSISPFASLLATLVPAFSYGLWFYSTNVEVYMPPLFFIMLALYRITGEKNFNRSLNAAILCHVLSILFHTGSVLFTPVLLWYIWNNRKEYGLIKPVLRYAIAGGGSVILVFFITGWGILGLHDKERLLTWLSGHGGSEGYFFPLSLTTAFNAFVGFGRCFIGGHFLFNLPAVNEKISKDFFYHTLEDELFLARDISNGQVTVLMIFTILVIGIVLFMLSGIFRRLKTVTAGKKNLLFPLLLTLVLFSAFFFFFLPQNVELWITQMVIAWLLVTGLWLSLPSFADRLKKAGVSLLALLLLVVNFAGSIRWLRNPQYDLFYVKSKEIATNLNPDDLIILEDTWLIRGYLKKYSRATVEVLHKPEDIPGRIRTDSLVNAAFTRGGKLAVYMNQSFMHAVKNKPYMDSLTAGYTAGIDTLPSAVSSVIFIRNKK